MNLQTKKLKSTFTELESPTSFGTTRLFTLYSTRIASNKSFCTQRSFIFRIYLHQSASNSQAQSLRLSSKATATQIYLNVVFLCNAELVQRLLDHVLKNT